MKRFGLLAVATGAIFLVFASVSAKAQNQRSWVAGNGDDAEACTYTAPCKTFTGALSKTNSGGEINCINAGQYGAMSITKSIIISCEAGTAGIFANSSNGVTVNAAPTDVVVLRGLDIEGLSVGNRGIRFVQGASLVVDAVRIDGMANAGAGGLGIDFSPTTPATLTVINTIITRSGNSTSGGGGGILITANGAGASARAFLDNVTIAAGFVGLGVVSSGPYVTAQVMNSKIVNNANIGIIQSGNAIIRIGRSAITNNLGASSSGTILSYGDNQISDNAPNVIPTSAGGYY